MPPSDEDQPIADQDDGTPPGQDRESAVADRIYSSLQRHKVITGVVAALVVVMVAVTGVVDPFLVFEVTLGVNAIGLLAILAVAAWRFGHRRT